MPRKIEKSVDECNCGIIHLEEEMALLKVIKQKGVNYVVVSSTLHVFERSTAPYIVSTSQPSVGRTTLATLSQQLGARLPRASPLF
jgi:hypothetical protein